jgi:hypothetical protein
MKSAYEILEIPWSATEAEIKSAYRRLAKKYHPDVNKAPSASQMFGLINQAFEQLKGKGKSPSPPPINEPPRSQYHRTVERRSAASYAFKLYEFVPRGASTVTVESGVSKLPADTCIFLMRGETEIRVVLKEPKTVPFILELDHPQITLKVE